MKLTIIIPTYNRVDLLRQAIASVTRQSTGYKLDILVVDDGSQDGTPAYLSQLAMQEPAVRCVRQENAGVTAARNTGLKNLLPDTDLVTFLDSDDTFPSGYFEATEGCFAQDPKLDLTYGKILMVESIDPDTLEPAEGAQTVLFTAIQLSSTIMRRSVVDQVGLFDETLKQAEDVDFLLRVFETAPNIAETSDLCLYYRRHPGNMTKNLDESKRYFALALLKSMQRRRKNPQLRMVKPQFDCESIGMANFY